MSLILTPSNYTNGNIVTADTPVIIDGFSSNAVIDAVRINCGRVKGKSDAMLQVRCPIKMIRAIELTGIVHPEDEIERWCELVANGVVLFADNVRVLELIAQYIHTPLIMRGRDCEVESGQIDCFSGDGFQMVANYNKITTQYNLTNSIERFPYDEFHRDCGQLFDKDKNVLIGCEINGVTYDHSKSQYESPPPQGICGFDHQYQDIKVTNCTLLGVNPEHGVSFGCAHNTIVQNVVTDATIRFGGRKGEPNGSNNYVSHDCKAMAIAFEDGSQMAESTTPAPKLVSKVSGADYYGQFDTWIDSLKNLQAPALTDQDYETKAERLSLEAYVIKGVWLVEALGNGFEANGLCKGLYERHRLKDGIESQPGLGIDSKAVAKRLGSELYSGSRGGYKGGVAEWYRLREVVAGLSEITGSFDFSLELALQSFSVGGCQLLGSNHRIVGYPAARDMVEAFHDSEHVHLSAFCAFIENEGLLKHLQAMTKADNPYPYAKQFALGYNGKKCCPKGSPKDYAAKIVAAVRKIKTKDEPVELKLMSQSRTMQGTLTSITSTGVGLAGAAKVAYENIDTLLTTANDLKSKVSDLTEQASSLKENTQVLLQQSSELIALTSNLQWWIYGLAVLLIISIAGNIRAYYARLDDRHRGIK